MTDVREFLGGQYLNAADLQGRSHVVTIEAFSTDEEFERTKRDGSKYMKRLPVLNFVNKKKRMVCTPRKMEALAFMFGPSLEDWVGKRITLKPGKTPFGAGMVDCVEVHPAEQLPQVTQARVTQPQPRNGGQLQPVDKDAGRYQTLERQPVPRMQQAPSDPLDEIHEEIPF